MTQDIAKEKEQNKQLAQKFSSLYIISSKLAKDKEKLVSKVNELEKSFQINTAFDFSVQSQHSMFIEEKKANKTVECLIWYIFT